MLCPKTHYDMIANFRPAFVRDVAEAARTRPDSQYASTDKDVDEEAFSALMKRTILGYVADMMVRNGYSADGLTYERAVDLLPPGIGERMVVASRLEYVFFGNYEQFGRKTFFFSENLTRRLADTELNVGCELLKPPYPACMFVFENQEARDAVCAAHGMPTIREGVVTAYVNFYEREEGGVALGVYICMTTRKGEMPVAFVRSLNLPEGGTVEEALRTDWIKIHGGNRVALPGYEDAVADDGMFFGPGLRMMRTIANSILYLASSNPDISPGRHEAQRSGANTPSAKERRRIERTVTPGDYILVGGSSPYYSGDAPAATERTLGHRLKVRGHWKKQAHGPGMSERKIIHVDPYWKGPETAEVISKAFVVR